MGRARDTLNTMAPRVMAVLDPLKVVIDNYPDDEVEWLDGSYWPHDIPKEGTRKVPFTKTLYIARSDFSEDPPKGWRRMALGAETRLRYGYVVKPTSIERDDTGRITTLHVDYDPETRSGTAPAGRKVKGTIHWVSATEGVRVPVHLYDRLFKVPNPDSADGTLLDHVNPDSLEVIEAIVEPSLRDAQKGSHWQFERTGYFVVDSGEGGLRFNRTVGLKDTWSKPETALPRQRLRSRPRQSRQTMTASGSESGRPRPRCMTPCWPQIPARSSPRPIPKRAGTL